MSTDEAGRIDPRALDGAVDWFLRLTSGATTDACARALLRAGAAKVDVLVFARVVDPLRAPI